MGKYFLFCALIFFYDSPAQELEWAKRTGGAGFDFGGSMALDDAGNIYTIGSFEGIADLDPGTAVYNMTAAGYEDIFILKLDNAGNFIWAKSIGGAGGEGYGYSIAVDASGNIYGAGYFSGTLDFDPGPGVFSLSSAGLYDLFLFRLDASGNLVWAKRTGGPGFEFTRAISIDASANIYMTGFFGGTVDFDPGPGVFNLTAQGDYDLFISKLDALGNFMWAGSMGAGGMNEAFGYDIKVDAAGNIYATGEFWGTIDFNPGAGTAYLTSAGSYDIFLLKLDASGNFLWAKGIGGTGADFGYGIAVDAAGNVVATGSFRGVVDFDPGPGVFNLPGAGNGDIFVLKLDAAGNFAWAGAMGGSGLNWGLSVTLDASGNVYTTGNFEGIADFDPGAGVFNLTAMGFDEIFISCLSPAGDFLWAQQIGGAGAYIIPYIILADNSGNLYSTGEFYNTIDFDPGPGLYNLTSAGDGDIFFYKLSLCSQAPAVTISPENSAICSGNSIQLAATGADTYTWSPAAGLNTTTGAVVIATPDITTTYTVTGTTAGCTGTSSVTITVNPVPTVAVSAASNNICQGGSTQINASGADSYSWSPAAGLSASTGATVTASPSATTTYTVTGTTGGCSHSQDITITVNPQLIPSITIGFSGCPGNSLAFTATLVNGGAGPQVNWYVDNILSGSGTGFNLSGAANGMKINATLTSSASCASPQIVSSDTITISCITTGIPDILVPGSFSVSPNPAAGVFTVQLELSRVSKVNFMIRDVMGRKIYSSGLVTVSGSHMQRIDLSMQPSGVYFLETGIGGQALVNRIVVQR